MSTQPRLPMAQPVEHDDAEFDAAVARGEYDANGYTPAEARAARKRGTYNDLLTKLSTGALYICAWCNTLQPAVHACWDEERPR